MKIIEIFENYQKLLGQEIYTKGWVKTYLEQEKMFFIELSDGTTQKNLKLIIDPEKIKNLEEIKNITIGSSISIEGILQKNYDKNQKFELMANYINIYQICSNDFPLQKPELSMDDMRTFPHFRQRSDIMRALFIIKSVIVRSIHDFFKKHHYTHIGFPILTKNKYESGYQPLSVTSLLENKDINKIPVVTEKIFNTLTNVVTIGKGTDIDFSKDFLGNPVYLRVSNQIPLECFIHGTGYVYTITESERNELWKNSEDLVCYSMLEYEGIFETLCENIDIMEKCIKYCAWQCFDNYMDELEILNKTTSGKLLPKLEMIISKPFIRIEHRNAIELLREEHSRTPFVDEPLFPSDLTNEHQQWLAKYFGRPVIVMHYPKKSVKIFNTSVASPYNGPKKLINFKNSIFLDSLRAPYNTIDGIEYTDCFYLLTDIGETVVGSMRIWDLKELMDNMEENKFDTKDLNLYLDMRKYGSIPHGGARLGIERLVAVLTGMDIKDCISFPIIAQN